MENVFEIVIQKLIDVGFYDLLIFIFSFTIFYAIMKKLKIFEDTHSMVTPILAFSAAFLVFGYPVLVGFSLTLPMVTFFSHALLWVMIFFMGFLVASLFYPDLPGLLSEKMTSRNVLYVGIAIGIVSAVISGMVAILWEGPPDAAGPEMPLDTTYTAAGVIIFVVLLIIATQVTVRSH